VSTLTTSLDNKEGVYDNLARFYKQLAGQFIILHETYVNLILLGETETAKAMYLKYNMHTMRNMSYTSIAKNVHLDKKGSWYVRMD